MRFMWMRRWGMLAVVLCIAPLLAVAQPQPREPRSDSGADRSRGAMQVVNDWRDEVSLSMWSDQRERLGSWSIRPGEQVVLQEGGQRLKIRPNYKIQVGEEGGWIEVGQVGQFQNGTWYVSVRDVWQATHRDRPRDSDERRGYDERRGEVAPREPDSPRGETSPLDQILKKLK
jgi:hypothetical protein